ncbi:hypothetical protein NE857_21860 [Nocardiopsis exhalans]|uniref:Uncharacterized protein n=1 Tax=Nocardiopsis exhalans TaxID=163604 RepID=A0ABY5D444_9ACTN|nr:hypothetical protein [Nocardiopsis exhalans]USY17964.1 hypothetical protein NE857_21860 [Nocardiopsis exhalans]
MRITQDRGRAAGSEAGQEGERERVGIRLSSTDRERAAYWADKRGYPSVNEYMATAVIEKISRENGDFDVPDLLTARLNQLIDENKALSTNVANLERVVTSSLDSLIGLTRGENYLSDQYEDGEL